jgi:integrase
VVKDLPVRRRQRLKFWDARQVELLLGAVAEHSASLYWITLFLLETGCRKGEALALEFNDVDLKRALVRIQPNEEWQPKDNEAREIPLDPKGLLFQWLKSEATSGRRFVFVSRNKSDGREPLPFAFWPQRKFDRARRAAGHLAECEDCKKRSSESATIACSKHGLVGGPHTTRHTYATHFLARVPDLYLLGTILGHSHERVTKLYAHLLPDHLDRARGAVAFKSPLGVAELKAQLRWAGPGLDRSSTDGR